MMKKIYALLTFSLLLSISLKAQTIDSYGTFDPIITDQTKIAYFEFSFADNGIIGKYDCAIALSQNPIVAFADYSAVVAIYETGFKFRNGGVFANEAVVIPVPGQVYKMWFTLNVAGATYTVDYQTEGVSTPVRLATNYAFRTKSGVTVTKIDTWNCFHNPAGEADVVTTSKVEVVSSVPTSVSGPFASDNFKVTVQNNAIAVSGVDKYEVYNVLGMKVASVSDNAEGVKTSLSKGLYVVKAGNATQKVLVK